MKVFCSRGNAAEVGRQDVSNLASGNKVLDGVEMRWDYWTAPYAKFRLSKRELFHIVIRLYSKHIYPSDEVPHNQIDHLFDW